MATTPEEEEFPDGTALIIMFRKSGACEVYRTDDVDDIMDVINGLRETAGTLELELRIEQGEFDPDLNDGDDDGEV